jgi:hypothetical protein
MGARKYWYRYKNHQSWQGKVYSSEEMRTVCGLGEMLGFADINCYYIRFPFIPGISKRKYTNEWLEEQNRKENEKNIFHGKKYETYGALQYQRKLERMIRKQKQDVELLEKDGVDQDDITAAKCRLRLTNKTYVDFSKKMGLRQQREGLRIPNNISEHRIKTVIKNDEKIDILKQANMKEDIQVHLIGKIDRSIYDCITNDIRTDEVIITGNQMQHILDRHPDAYEKVVNYLGEAIQNPDYIIEDKHENTGLVIKCMETGNTHSQIVLRICTTEDEPGYKNSIISCWEISDKRLQNYLRNKRVLYKKE